MLAARKRTINKKKKIKKKKKKEDKLEGWEDFPFWKCRVTRRRCWRLSSLFARRRAFTWSSMSPSDKPAHFPLLPFCPFTPGNMSPLLLTFGLAAEEGERRDKTRFQETCWGQWREGSLGGTGALQLIQFPAARFLFRFSWKSVGQYRKAAG